MRPPPTSRSNAPAILGLSLAASALMAFAPGQSHAQSSNLSINPDDGWYMPIGLTAGLVNHGGQVGHVIGGELSIVHLSAVWFGFYTDALYDTHRETTRVSFGPEFGVLFFGFDFGAIIETGGGTRFGTQSRVVLTSGILTPYFRGGLISTEDDEGLAFSEAGVLLKIPFSLDGGDPFK